MDIVEITGKSKIELVNWLLRARGATKSELKHHPYYAYLRVETNGYTYATDGRVMNLVDTSEISEDFTQGYFYQVESILAKKITLKRVPVGDLTEGTYIANYKGFTPRGSWSHGIRFPKCNFGQFHSVLTLATGKVYYSDTVRKAYPLEGDTRVETTDGYTFIKTFFDTPHLSCFTTTILLHMTVDSLCDVDTHPLVEITKGMNSVIARY